MRKIPNLHLFPGGSRRLDLVALILAGVCRWPGRASGQRRRTTQRLPYARAWNLSSMDKSIESVVNFTDTRAEDGGKKNPIPADQTFVECLREAYQDNLISAENPEQAGATRISEIP